jgi:hypothetical protein
MPELSPVSPIKGADEGLKKEETSHADIEGWLADRYMSNSLIGTHDYAIADLEDSHQRYPEYWASMDQVMDEIVNSLVAEHGASIKRLMDAGDVSGAMAYLNGLISEMSDSKP